MCVCFGWGFVARSKSAKLSRLSCRARRRCDRRVKFLGSIEEKSHLARVVPRGQRTMGAAQNRASCSSAPQSTTDGTTGSSCSAPSSPANEAKDASSPLLRSEDLVPAMLFAWPVIAAAGVAAYFRRPSHVRSSMRSARRL